MKKERIGFAFCGSFCTHKKVLEQYLLLTQEYETVIPIVSESAASTDTRFGSAADFLKTVETAAGRSAIRCIRDAEPIGPKKLLDALVIAPCTGNTLAKLSGGVTDSTVTLAAKAHLRNGRPYFWLSQATTPWPVTPKTLAVSWRVSTIISFPSGKMIQRENHAPW